MSVGWLSMSDLYSFSATLEKLFNMGVRYSTVIDVGCADGHFFLIISDCFTMQFHCTLVKELAVKPPFDVQGAEKAALAGANAALKQSLTVICEADVDDFQDINIILANAEFDLYDITVLNCIKDGTLGWFYPVYINNKLENLDAQENNTVIGAQVARRIADRVVIKPKP
jgi:hypothetical protein